MTCDKTAVALLTFSPPDAKAWLYDLDRPDPTGGIMLCRKHANATVVPMSWQLVDARDPAWPGPAGSTPALEAMVAASAEEVIVSPERSLDVESPSIDREFAMSAAAPASAMLYTEASASPTAHVAAAPTAADYTPESDRRVDLGAPAPDPSLFELPIMDIPAVTPYPR